MRREQLPNTDRPEVSVAVRPDAPIQHRGEIYMGFHYANIVPATAWVWLDGNAWDLDAFLMAQRSTT